MSLCVIYKKRFDLFSISTKKIASLGYEAKLFLGESALPGLAKLGLNGLLSMGYGSQSFFRN